MGPRRHASGYITEGNNRLHVAFLGKLYAVELDRLVQDVPTFRFVEQQDQFVLEAGKRARLVYNAPGATKYHFQLWYQRPHFLDEEPALAMESSDGTFELPLDNMDQYVGWALEAASVRATDRSAEERSDRVQNYLQQITPAYQRLTGRKPRGIPFPIYVSVIAEHEDGQQKAGLAHAYLIEVPQQQIEQRTSAR